MNYQKPGLVGYSAISTVQTSGQNAKTMSKNELGNGLPSQPAYEADE